MINQLLDIVEDDYRDYYYQMKRILFSSGIKISYKIKVNSLRGVTAVNEDPISRKIEQEQFLRDPFDMINSLLYLAGKYEDQNDKKLNQFKGRIPFFQDEAIRFKVSLNDDFSNSIDFDLLFDDRYQKDFFLPLLGSFKPEQTLYVSIKLLNESVKRHHFENNYFTDTYVKELKLLIDDSRNEFITKCYEYYDEEKTKPLEEKLNIFLSSFPFNNVIKGQIFLSFLDTYLYDSPKINFDEMMQDFAEKKLGLAEKVVQVLKKIEEAAEKGETLYCHRPVFLPYSFQASF